MAQPASKRLVTEGGTHTISGAVTFTARPTLPQLAVASLPATAAVVTTGTTRPTVPTGVVVIFTGADPGANAANGDIWLGA